MTDIQESMWIFGYGSLIWGTGEVKTIERREGILLDWHREWTWIASTRHGAPTCSLKPGGQVRGVFLRLNPMTARQDLQEVRRRENKKTEEISADIPDLGAKTYFWTMGSNLDRFPEFAGLRDDQLAMALAERSRNITQTGPMASWRATICEKYTSLTPTMHLPLRSSGICRTAGTPWLEPQLWAARTQAKSLA